MSLKYEPSSEPLHISLRGPHGEDHAEDHQLDHLPKQREFFIGNLLVRIHFIIVMMRWTGLVERTTQKTTSSITCPKTIGTVLNLRTTTSQKCDAVPRRAPI